MKYLSLFTGIGGFDMGFDAAGMQCVGQVEMDKSCTHVLRRHWPDTTRLEDVRNVTADTFQRPDVICGGFPCQDLSVAGRRRGLAGKQSGLWWEFARIISLYRPRIVVIENVPGLLSSNAGRDLAVILRWLGDNGYWWTYRVLDSQYFGVAQRRRRVFIVASLGGASCVEILFEREGLCRNPAEGRKAGEDVAGTFKSRSCSGGFHTDPGLAAGGYMQVSRIDLANTLTQSDHKGLGHNRDENVVPVAIRTANTGANGHGVAKNMAHTLDGVQGQAVCFPQNLSGTQCATTENLSPNIQAKNPTAVCYETYGGNPRKDRPSGGFYIQETNRAKTLDGSALNPNANQGGIAVCSIGVRRLTPTECERLQGFPDGHTAWGVDETGKQVEISDTQRYRMLGNAVTATVGAWIGKRIRRQT